MVGDVVTELSGFEVGASSFFVVVGAVVSGAFVVVAVISGALVVSGVTVAEGFVVLSGAVVGAEMSEETVLAVTVSE